MSARQRHAHPDPAAGKVIEQPVFIANGDDDRMILPWYSHLTASLIPDAFVKLYPDAAHGFLFQHAHTFVSDVIEFLDA